MHSARYIPQALKNPRAWLVVLLLVLTCYRMSLVGSGHFFWGDERCYLPAVELVNDLASGEYHSAAARLHQRIGAVSPARPGFVLISVIPVVAQRFIGPLLGIAPDTVRSYDIAAAFNVLVSVGVTVCLFALGRVWTRNGWYALLMAAVYSLLSNANVWIRHMVPYNESLLLFLAALWLLSPARSAAGRGVARVAAGGILSALAYACYPGHYVFVGINAMVAWLAFPRHRAVRAVAFGASWLTVIGAFELVARWTDMSYIADSSRLAKTITMGYFGEGYVFAWRYMRYAEGAAGIALFILFCWCAVLLPWRRFSSVPRPARIALAAAVGGYLFHASLGVLLHKMVFYGRTFMVFIPFIVGGAVLTLMHLRRPVARGVGVCALVAASLYSFANFAFPYARIVYPADFLQRAIAQLGFETVYPPNLLWRFEDAGSHDSSAWLSPGLSLVVDSSPAGQKGYFLVKSHEQARDSGAEFIGANLSYMGYIADRDDRFSPPDGYTAVAAAPHPETMPAIGFFEGRKPWERERLARRRYMMRLYRRDDDAAHVAMSSKVKDVLR